MRQKEEHRYWILIHLERQLPCDACYIRPISTISCLLLPTTNDSSNQNTHKYVSSSTPIPSSLSHETMAFLSTRTESHVLKLVHPGGIVELYSNPVSASEIMKKYPRHLITRPDFFKFPWIVVSPQAILTPGKVFFIVPSHTIRHLLKNNNSQSQSRSSIEPSEQVSRTQSFKQRCKTHQEGHHNQKHRNRGGDKVHAFAAGEYTSRDLEKVPKLKPCLKKKDKNLNAARSRDRRVRFQFIEDEVNINTI